MLNGSKYGPCYLPGRSPAHKSDPLEYLCIYFHEWAYMEPQRQAERKRASKRRVYDTLQISSPDETKPWEVRIMQLQPAIDCSPVWDHLHNLKLSDGARSAWYMVIHDIIPTNARLHRIRLMDTDNCTQCRRQDTMLHRLTECGVGQEIWEWTRTRIARIQRTDRRLYARNGFFVPVCNYGPDKDIRLYCGFWRIWFFFIWCINAGGYH